jgi:hypothetical protein
MPARLLAVVATHVVLVGSLAFLPTTADAQDASAARTGRQIYETVCITCHGPEGRGGVNLELEKIVPVPDFTDCAFASREPDRGFVAVAHGGGPARGFSPLMPPWGGAFTEDELGLAVGHLRTFCTDQRWPRGELNLPRPFVTAKAFPEDEIVVATTARSGAVTTKFYYEKRFGPLNQFEIVVPFTTHDEGAGRATGIGDVALEYKRTLAHSQRRGRIVSVTGEFVLPTGNEANGLGGGTAVFEPFVTFGQALRHAGFLQSQVGFGIPMRSREDNELFWRVAVGKTFEYPRFGRNWTPMMEFLAARPLVSGGSVEWDVLPGAQVTINRRQHVRLAGGVRLPVTDADTRTKSVIVYLLWDWYEGGILQGW